MDPASMPARPPNIIKGNEMGVRLSSCLVRGVLFDEVDYDIVDIVEEIEGVEAGLFGDLMGGEPATIVFEQGEDDFVELSNQYGLVKYGVYNLYEFVKLLGDKDKDEFDVLMRALETLEGMGYPRKTAQDINIYYCSNVS